MQVAAVRCWIVKSWKPRDGGNAIQQSVCFCRRETTKHYRSFCASLPLGLLQAELSGSGEVRGACHYVAMWRCAIQFWQRVAGCFALESAPPSPPRPPSGPCRCGQHSVSGVAVAFAEISHEAWQLAMAWLLAEVCCITERHWAVRSSGRHRWHKRDR